MVTGEGGWVGGDFVVSIYLGVICFVSQSGSSCIPYWHMVVLLVNSKTYAH